MFSPLLLFCFLCFAQEAVLPMEQDFEKVQQYEPPLKKARIDVGEQETAYPSLLDLPIEINFHIFSFIKPIDLLKISTTCSLFKEITKEMCKHRTICNSDYMITDIHVPGICQQTTLFSFKISLYQFSIDSISLFAGSILRRLDLSHCKMGDPGAFALANNSSLFKLSLAGCKLSDEGAVALFKNSSIKKLNLCGNNLTDKCLESFSILNNTLLGLNLRRNMLTDVGAQSLAQSSSLKTVYLYANRIRYTGIKKLIKSSITKIELSLHMISLEEKRKIGEMIKDEQFKGKTFIFYE